MIWSQLILLLIHLVIFTYFYSNKIINSNSFPLGFQMSHCSTWTIRTWMKWCSVPANLRKLLHPHRQISRKQRVWCAAPSAGIRTLRSRPKRSECSLLTVVTYSVVYVSRKPLPRRKSAPPAANLWIWVKSTPFFCKIKCPVSSSFISK